MHDCCICQPAAFWRRRVADLVGPFRLDLHLAMDYEYWLRIDRAGGRIEALEDVLASSRLYPETKTLSAREAVYREVFAVCLEHGGYVDASYFHGLWHHRLAERRDGWRRALPPRAYVLAAGLHHRAFHLRRKLPQLPGRLARGLGKKRRLGRVVGFFGDGWLGPRVEVLLPEGHGLRAGWLTGTAPQAGVVEVSCRGRTSRIELPGGTRSRIEVALEPGVRQTVRLRFSAPITDAVSRRLAFLLDGTNLFTEHDPAAPDRTTLARAAVRSLAG